MADLADVLALARAWPRPGDRPGRLVLECPPAVALELSSRDPRPEWVPHPEIPVGTGATYRQVEVHAKDMPAGAWRLVEDGEIIASGTVE